MAFFINREQEETVMAFFVNREQEETVMAFFVNLEDEYSRQQRTGRNCNGFFRQQTVMALVLQPRSIRE